MLDELQGSAETLQDHFTAFARNDVFAVGVDATAPGSAGRSAILFSGDDGHFGSITPPLDAGALDDLGATLARSAERMDAVAPGRGKEGRRIAPKQVQAAPDASLSPDAIRSQPGVLAVGRVFATVAAMRSEGDRNPIVHLYFRPDGSEEWSRIYRFDPHWLEGLRKVVGSVTTRRRA